MLSGAPPLHVVAPLEGHGVTILAHQVAESIGASTADLDAVLALSPRHVHVHVTEALFGGDPEEAARRLVALGARHRMTVTLHDVPQPGNAHAFERRVRAYRAVTDAAAGWVVSSHHERRLLEEHVAPRGPGEVVHLPVVAGTTPAPGPRGERTGPPVVGLLGWLYPGKGHAQVLAACAGLGVPLVVRALGGVSPGHQPLVDELTDLALAGGLQLEVTGWLDDEEMAETTAAVSVPVCAHRSVSASGSLNSWVSAGRRPVVVDGAYAAEIDDLRPGTLHRVPLAGLRAAIGSALADPGSTWLGPSAVVRPDLDDVAASYLRWWRTLS